MAMSEIRAIEIPMIAHFAIFFPAVVCFSSPYDVIYIPPAITRLIVAIIPNIDKRKFRTLVAICPIDRALSVPDKLDPIISWTCLRNVGAAITMAKPITENNQQSLARLTMPGFPPESI